MDLQLRDLTNCNFGDYHIIRRIGVGAMAEVYLARQESLSRQVALKILKPELAQDSNGVKRFVREAKAAASLVHPNIVHIYEVNRFESYWYIAQEYVQGANLHTLVNKTGPFPSRQVALILWQVASALQKAAQSGIVHRDIKPDNILLGDNGEMKVADFGLAYVEKALDAKTAQLTQTGMTLGTPIYMSPEQAEGKPLDHRSDIYSLGITAYQLLTGSPPFQGDTAIATALMHLNKQPQYLCDINPQIPEQLCSVVHRMIEKSPDKRYQSIPELLDDIRKILTELGDSNIDFGPSGVWNDARIVVPAPVDDSLLAARNRLQQSMQMENLSSRKHLGRYGFFAVLLLVALFLGMITAYAKYRSEFFRIPQPNNESLVQRRNTVPEQWILACHLDSEEGWKSVIDFASDEAKPNWERKARQQLAVFYMKDDKPDKAYAIFQEFEDLTDTELYAKAFGTAGIFWYYAKQSYRLSASEAMAKLYSNPLLDISKFDELTNSVLSKANELNDALRNSDL